jgi:hypothetical protein
MVPIRTKDYQYIKGMTTNNVSKEPNVQRRSKGKKQRTSENCKPS